ncbi:MAG: hypothetical protein R3C01_08125 [Planctomycetaceae bacterium]
MAVEDEPVAERFGGEQELEQKAQAAAVSRAGVQAVEACSTGQTATLQTGTACEDRDSEAKTVMTQWLAFTFSKDATKSDTDCFHFCDSLFSK